MECPNTLQNFALANDLIIEIIGTKMIPRRFNESVLLNTKFMRGWLIEIERRNENLWFGERWNLFLNFYKIKHGDCLLFKYVTEGRFVVSLFDSNGLQFNNDHMPRTILPVQFYKKVDSDDFATQFILPEYFTTSLLPVLETNLPKRFNIIDKKHQGSSWTVNCSVVDGLAGSGLIGNMVKIDETYKIIWKVEITPAAAAQKSKPLYIPTGVVHGYLYNRPANVKVKVPSGEIKTWDLIWSSRSKTKTECYIGEGWKRFKENHEIVAGKIVYFRKKYADAHWTIEARVAFFIY